MWNVTGASCASFSRGTNGHPGLLSVIENTFALLEKVQKAANVVLPL